MSGTRPLNIQLWSYNYDPEPTGIAPISTLWAREMAARGHRVEVVAAHPHYPSPEWGRRLLPYREHRDGVPVLRLPLAVGRSTVAQRIRQELTFTAAQLLALPALGSPDVVLVVSPSFPALLAAVMNARLRRVPWVLWLKDILPDGAAATGLVRSGPLMSASRWLERTAYRSADRIVVISESFAENLERKGVKRDKLALIYDPATRRKGPLIPRDDQLRQPHILSMGNIGHTQGLPPLVAAFERSPELRDLGVRLVITGDGVAADDVRREIVSESVEMLGMVDDRRLESELEKATLALVSQQYEGAEFNLPSKLMNFMTYGIPVVAAVNPRSEVARLVEASGGGWVVDSSVPEQFPDAVRRALEDPTELARRGEAGYRYAEEHFALDRCVDRMEAVVSDVSRRS